MISVGRGFEPHPGQSFSLSFCGPISLIRANAYAEGIRLGISKHCNLPLNYSDLSIISATRPSFHT